MKYYFGGETEKNNILCPTQTIEYLTFDELQNSQNQIKWLT